MKFLVLFLLSVSSIYAQSGVFRDSVRVKIIRVVDGDTFVVKYGKETLKIRIRTENPRDTVDTFDIMPRRAEKQAAQFGISLSEVHALYHAAAEYMDSLLTGKTVYLRRYPDQTDLGRQFSFDRLIRGVEFRGKNVADLLRARHLTVDSFEKR